MDDYLSLKMRQEKLITPFKFMYGNFEARFIEGCATYSYNLTGALEPRFGYSKQNGGGYSGCIGRWRTRRNLHDNKGDGASLPHGHFGTLSSR